MLDFGHLADASQIACVFYGVLERQRAKQLDRDLWSDEVGKTEGWSTAAVHPDAGAVLPISDFCRTRDRNGQTAFRRIHARHAAPDDEVSVS